MAGGHTKYRALSRKSSHRQALLRNLVTSLFTHESITTTWEKAKEAQRLAEKLVTYGKKNTEASRLRAWSIFYNPKPLVHKLTTEIKARYANRPGGYTRVLRVEPKSTDQAESAILELVDGPKDMRFAITARALAKQRTNASGPTDITMLNVQKVTRFRPDGMEAMEALVSEISAERKQKVLDERDRIEGEEEEGDADEDMDEQNGKRDNSRQARKRREEKAQKRVKRSDKFEFMREPMELPPSQGGWRRRLQREGGLRLPF